MKRAHPPSGLPLGIQKLSEIDVLDAEGRNTALAKIFSTREVRQALGNILPDLLRVFAGDKKIKKFIFKLVGRYLNKSLVRPTDVFEENELKRLFEDERFLQHLTEPLPDIISGLFDIIATAANTIENLDTDEKKALFKDLVSKTATGRTGEIITRACRILNDIHKDDPEFFAKAIEPGFEKWIESMDFGEIKEAVENSAQDTRAFVKMVNNVMWQHPAKVVLLLSLLPTLLNILTDSAGVSLSRFNQLPPDLVADVSISFLNELDGKTITVLLNEVTELVRKLDTGSRLVGEPGSPRLPKAISSLVDTIIDGMDPVVLWKAKIAAAGIKAEINEAVAEAVTRRDDFRKTALGRSPEIFNIRARSLNRRLAWWESADDHEAATAFAGHVGAYDIQEMGDAVTTILRIFNRVCDQKPDILPEIAGNIAGAVDGYELAEAGRHLFEKNGEKLKPLARALVPKIVNWVCDVIAVDDDEYEEDAARARQSLAALLAMKEA